MQSPYRTTLKSTRYSVGSAENKAVQIATTITKHLPRPELTSANMEEFVEYLCKNTKHSRIRVVELLRRFLPMKIDGISLLRLSYAIDNYFKYFDPLDIEAAPPYIGTPEIKAHAKIVSAIPTVTGKAISVRVVFMLMTSIFAGDLKEITISLKDADKLSDTLGIKRITGYKCAPYPQDLFGCYCTVTIGNKPNQVAVVKEVIAETSEKRTNKSLRKDRLTHDCGNTNYCAFCEKTVRDCPLACRY